MSKLIPDGERATIVILTKREDPFARIPKTILTDDRLSWKAKGILCYLLSKPTDWKTRVKDICNQSTEGEASVRSGLFELRTFGYALLTRIVNETGRVIEWVWKISDSPIFNPDDGFSKVEMRHSEKPDVEKPDVENRNHTKKDSNKNEGTENYLCTPKEKKSSKISKSSPHIPTPQEALFYGDSLDLTAGDSLKFHDHYQARGWELRGSPIRDWKALMRTWRSSKEMMSDNQPRPTGGPVRVNL